ncbi:putative RING-H2 finger protein ATL49 [Amborella trichopoda]|uniref:RING-type E3 ubiquitin transferase n=1 Tax=Amborella trichopoda TaxID=13333 RepID=W1NTU7_AMBTC|nr:putative RING-H2 finger protein ATL49 [Amborella trichopoda]ERN01007.1 hypothetical protein AMTR_s00002p00126990 [Amborella trichopoda]|eukprot:XP_006838438.1 putative RING-H2 finger protein ATL49 [Amborella trichopoda]
MLLSVLYIPSPPPPPPPHLSSPFPRQELKPSILIILLILATVFLVSFSIHLLIRFLERETRPHTDDERDSTVSHSQTHFIETLPLFYFDSITGLGSRRSDCAICLSEFKQSDSLRLLPNCTHAFHAHCIDAWLTANSTCPLCRAMLSLSLEPHSLSLDPNPPTMSTLPSNSSTPSLSDTAGTGQSFRLEIGSFREKSETSSSINGDDIRRCFSMGDFEYVLDSSESHVFITRREPGHRHTISECAADLTEKGPDIQKLEGVGHGSESGIKSSGRWLKEYLEKLVSSSSESGSLSSRRALSFFSFLEKS